MADGFTIRIYVPDGDPDGVRIIDRLTSTGVAIVFPREVWWAIRISRSMLPKIKYIAGYQTRPVQAITHVAPVAEIVPYGEEGKFKLVFSEPAKAITPIPFGNAPSGSMQGPRYTTYEKLPKAKTLSDLIA